MSKFTLNSLAFATAVGAMLTVTAAGADELSSGIVIRGIGATRTCSAKTVVPTEDQVDGRVQNLSVNCTNATDRINDYGQYTAGLPHTKFCVARILKIKQKSGSVKTDHYEGHPYHCLMNNIRVKELVSLMTPKP